MPPAARTASIALAGSLRSLQGGQLLFDQRRRGALAARLDAREQIALQAVFVGHEALEVGIRRIRLGHQIEQVERAAGSGRQIGGDGRDDASCRAGDQKDGVLVQSQAGLAVGCGLFLQSNRPALPFLVADLDCAGIAQSLLDEDVGDLRRLSFRFEIDRLDESVHPLALVGFGEARHRAAQRRDRSGLVVAVLSAEPCRRNQERARRRNLLVQSAHGGVERLDAHPQSFVPGGEVHVA